MDGSGRVAVLPAGQLVGAGGREGGEPGPDRQAACGGVDQLVGNPVEGVRVLAQDRGGGGSGPGGDLLDDRDGVAAQLGPGPSAALPRDAVVGRGRGGDGGDGPAGNLGESWERSVTPATLPLYSYGLLPPTGGVSLLLNL